MEVSFTKDITIVVAVNERMLTMVSKINYMKLSFNVTS